ncbi:hypothetical protein TNCV_1018801 [Trichonephila clavipes]|nr:hypothetical protein TNCV_1018801 [Trichonephila clavipes]
MVFENGVMACLPQLFVNDAAHSNRLWLPVLYLTENDFKSPQPAIQSNAINVIQLRDKSTDDFPVVCYTDDSKIDGRVGFAFVVFRSGVESEHFQFKIRNECRFFVAELLCLNFAIKWITE